MLKGLSVMKKLTGFQKGVTTQDLIKVANMGF